MTPSRQNPMAGFDPPRAGRITVLVVDDSVFMQRRLAELLQQDGDIVVVGTARDGDDGIRRALELRPDVITMDIEMPRMDGLAAIQHIMQTQPRPVVVVSSHARDSSVAAVKALELGAIELVAKPSAAGISLDIVTVGGELRRKVRLASRVRVVRSPRLSPVVPLAPPSAAATLPRLEPRPTPDRAAESVVLIGCSTGGPAALMEFARDWRGTPLPPLVVAQHLPAEFTGELARQMAEHLNGTVREAREGDLPHRGEVLITPGGRHLVFDEVGAVRLPIATGAEQWVPSIDRLFASGATAYGPRALGVVLTGMGNDGTLGAGAIRRAGGVVWAQDEATSVIDGMPRSVREAGHANRVLPLRDIGRAIAAQRSTPLS